MSQRTFDDFDEFADSYRDIHTENIKFAGVDSFYFAEMKVRLLQPFESNESLKVLDIGCGDGATELFMQRYFANWNVSGIDVSEKSIQEAKKRALSNTIFSIYNGTEVPAMDSSIDIVFVAGVLHHVEYIFHTAIIKEISRVLKKGGRLYIFEHNPLNPLTRYLVNTCVFDKDAQLLKSKYTSQLLQKNALEIKSKHFIIFFPRKGIFTKLVFLERYLRWLPLGGQYFIRATK
jgi:ubiquinone/menaquinone biosynthesis C-methylase UbiE